MDIDFIVTNHHILEKIFIRCKTPTLLQCRLVCRLWAEEVSRILRRRGITISFRSCEDIEDFLHVARPLVHSYAHFLVDIPSPRCPSEVVEQVPSQVADLLHCYKDDVLELKLWYQPQIQPPLSFEGIPPPPPEEENGPLEDEGEVVILRQLHTLHLLSNYVHPVSPPTGPQVQHQMPRSFSRLVTPHLRCLTVQHLYDTDCASTVIKLLESSENPVELLKIPAKPFPLVARGVQLQNLRELDLLGIFNGFSCATNDTLDAIIRDCARLEKLAIEFSFRATLDKIQEMLQKLSQTLVEFRCTIQDRNLLARQIIRVDFIFPEMRKLKVLQMRWSNPGLVYYTDRLPALEELLLDSVWTRKVQGSIFPGGQPFQEGVTAQFEKLTSLKLTEVVSVEQVENFAKYFPNLEILGASFASNEALRVVYEKMRGLRWLIIERKSNVTESGGLCGVEEDAMEKWTPKTEIVRSLPYIGNLEKLETLELCQLGISWCSLVYGVVDLPQLKTLVVQSKAFKVNSNGGGDGKNVEIVGLLAARLKQLRHLILWIRHTSERPSTEDTALMQQHLYFLEELSVLNHSLCGI